MNHEGIVFCTYSFLTGLPIQSQLMNNDALTTLHENDTEGVNRKKQHLWIERKYTRIDTDINCVVGLPGCDLAAGLIRDISEGGLNFSCERPTIYNIFPEYNRTPGLTTGVIVEVRFELQGADQATQTIKCNARLIHFERRSQDNFHIGIKFIKMDKATKNALRAYLESAFERQDR